MTRSLHYSRQKLLSIVPKVILIALGLLVGLLMAEVSARILYPIPSESGNSQIIKVGIPPEYIQYVDRAPWANSLTRHKVEGEYETIVSINGKGLRGPEVPYEKPDGEFRILYIGDSYVLAHQVEFDDTSYQQLETLLRDRQGHYEVIGAGQNGWGTDQAYRYYMYEGYQYQPDLVIYQFVGNDVSDNAGDTFKNSPYLNQLFSVEDGKLVARNLDIYPNPSYRYAAMMHRRLLLSSRFYTVIRDIWRGEGAARLAQPVYEQAGESASISNVSPQLLIFQEPYSDDYRAAWELTGAILSEWSVRVQEDGALFAVVSVPGRWVIYEEDWQEITERYPSLATEFDRWRPDKPDEYLSDITQRYDIPYLSLTATFREYAGKNNQRLYGHLDGHWTKTGHVLAAQTIFEWLLEQDLVE